MMPTPVDNRSGNGHSRWRVAGRAQVRSIDSCCRHRTASFLTNCSVRSFSPPCSIALAANQSRKSLRSNLFNRRAAGKSP